MLQAFGQTFEAWRKNLVERGGGRTLAIVSFANSTVLPLPAETLLAPLCYARPRAFVRYALICTAASVAGGIVAYALGAWAWEGVGAPLVDALQQREAIAALRGNVEVNGVFYVVAAALTPAPFKVVAVASGALGLQFTSFVAGAIAGRALGYFAVAWAAATGRALIDRRADHNTRHEGGPMPTSAVSRTARHMAAMRALETNKPAEQRLFADPYARRFLTPSHRIMVEAARLPTLRRWIERYADRRAPGARTSAIARTRLIDDWVRAEVAEGAEQIVLLGAGCDCRALRMPELAAVKVFEIDREQMIAFKARKLGEAPNLARVAADFMQGEVERTLLAAGYDRARRTLFIWEGVTNYLDADSVAGVFDFVAQKTEPRTRIIFTYVDAAAVAGSFDSPGLARLLEQLRHMGEPWTFGIAPETLTAQLAERGLRRIADLDADEYRRLYLSDPSPARAGYEFYHVVLAEVADAAR